MSPQESTAPVTPPDFETHRRLAYAETTTIQGGEFIQIPLDAPSIGEVKENGEPSYEIVAMMHTHSGRNSVEDYNPRARLFVLRKPADGSIHYVTFSDTNHELDHRIASLKSTAKDTQVDTSKGAPEVKFVVSPPATKKGSRLLTIAQPKIAGEPGRNLQLHAAPGAAIEPKVGQSLTSIMEAKQAYRNRRTTKIVASVALVGALAYGANRTGGGYDTIQDVNNDAGTTVTQMFPASENSPDQLAAVDRVAQAEHALDIHDNTALQAGAQKFEQDYKNQLMPASEVAQFQAELAAATDNQTILNSLNRFMNFYGKDAKFQTDDGYQSEKADGPSSKPFDLNTGVDSLRYYAQGIVDGMSPLPNSYFKEKVPYTVSFASPGVPDENGLVVGGLADQNNHIINFVVDGSKGAEARKESADRIIHEDAHYGDHARDNIPAKPANLLPASPTNMLLDNPDNVSGYAAANHDSHNEPYAEQYAQLLVNTGDGVNLPHPDRFRLFNSPAAKQMLAKLVGLEVKYSGISYQIIMYEHLADQGTVLGDQG